LALNPLSLQKNSENKNFLSDFFTAFIGQTKDVTFNNEIKFIPQIVDRILTSNANNFATAMEVFNAPETRKIYAKLKDWRQKSARKSENIFEAKEEIDWASQIMAFDLTEIIEDKSTFIPTATYLLHQIEASLDGSPAIIAINEAWEFFDNPVLGPKIGAFLNRMKEKNCVVIFSSQDIEHIAASKEVSGEIKKNIATAIFMPNPEPNKVYQTVFGLNEEEMNIVKMMDGDEYNFLFKHGEDSVIFTMDLAAMVEFTKVLSADYLTLTALEEVIAANITEENPNPTPEVWVPQLLEVLKEIEKERVIEEKKRIKEEDAKRRRLLKERLELNA
jgi:type IV secretion system protein VirB4